MTLSQTTQELQKYISKNNDLSKSNISESEISKKYQELIDCITDHNHLYYINSAPIISDLEYDQLFDYIKKIEEYNPQLISSNSPTQWLIGQFEIQDWFNKAEHKIPLLSLENSYNAEDITERETRITKILNKQETNKNTKSSNSHSNHNKQLSYHIEPKFDWISVELIYKNWNLHQAITRWDWITGEDITANTKTIKDIQKINFDWEIHLRWEIMIQKSQLEKLNKIREKNWENIFANTRNAASGSIKLLDTNIVAERWLVCYVYDILESNKSVELTELWLPIFKLENIKTNITSIQEIINICENTETKKYLDSQDLEFDWLVIKISDNNIRSIIWETTHHPKRAIAYKFPAEQVSTQIESIEFQVWRTGIITPVANLSPVNLSWATISRVSLHNFDFIKDKDIHHNDFVRLQRSGEVIPYITWIVKERRKNNSSPVTAPNTCPSCNTDLTQVDMHYYCQNSECPAQIKEKIIRFVSKNCMDIEWIGESIIETLVKHKIITNISDIYKLLNFETERIINKFPGFANKKITEIKKQLEESKNKEFRRLLNWLWIPWIGKKTAQDISIELSKQKNCNNLELITKYLTNPEFMISIYGIGDKIVEWIINYRNTKQELLQNLEKLWLNFDCTPENNKSKNNIEKKWNFCITWSFDFPRPKIIEEMEKSWYTFDSNPNKNTNYMLIWSKPWSKLTKAEELWVKIIKKRKNILENFPFLSELKIEQKKPQWPEQIWLF